MQGNRRHLLGGLVTVGASMTLDSHAEPSDNFSFIVLGDWGRDGTSHQGEVAAQMEVAAREIGCACVVTVGDNFYEDVVHSVDDPKWKSSFEDVYNGPRLKHMPWFAALGNHDYGSAPQAQIEYAALSSRWKMPSRYYKVSGAELGCASVDLFILDTCPMIADYRLGNGIMAANLKGQDAKAQLDWLDRELTASKAAFKFVFGHHTLFSGGSTHGDTPDLIHRLLPILKAHRVTAYVNGHDHDLQYIVRDGLNVICSGAGSKVRPVAAVPGTKFCAERSGFSIVSVHNQQVELAFRGYKGIELYRTALASA